MSQSSSKSNTTSNSSRVVEIRHGCTFEKSTLVPALPSNSTPIPIPSSSSGNGCETLFNWANIQFNLPDSIFEEKELNDVFIVDNHNANHNHHQQFHQQHEETIIISETPELHNHNQSGSTYLNIIPFTRPIFVWVPLLLEGVRKSLWTILTLLRAFVDLIIGLKTYDEKDLENKLHFERCKYLVAELRTGRSSLQPLLNFIQTQLDNCEREKIYLLNAKSPWIPYKFMTPTKVQIDLTLWDKSLTSTHISPTLTAIIRKANASTDSWFLETREKTVQKLGNGEENEFHGNRLVYEEFLERISREIRDSQELRNDVKPLLIEQLWTWFCLRCASDHVDQVLLPRYKKIALDKLKEENPLLSKDPSWSRMQENLIEKEFYEKNRFQGHELAMEMMSRRNLFQAAYFTQRDVHWGREVAPVLSKEIRNLDKKPGRSYNWHVCYRSEPLLKTDTSLHLHRTTTLAGRYLSALLSMLYWVMIFIPFDSPLSFRVLYRKQHGNEGHKTLRGQLEQVWRRVSKETRKAGGEKKSLIIKGAWYLYGVGMTITYGLGFTTLVTLVNFSCLLITLTCVVWPLLYTFGFYLFCLFIRDVDGYNEDFIHFPIFKISVLLLIQVGRVTASLALMGMCPLISGTLFLATKAKTLTLATYSKFSSRDHESKKPLITRPSTGDRFFFSITENQALLLLLSRIQGQEVNYFTTTLAKILSEPIAAYESFFESNISHYSCILSDSVPGFYRDLVKKTMEMKQSLDDLVNERRRKLLLTLPRDKIKIRDFDGFCTKAVALTIKNYERMIREYGLSNFWGEKGLEPDDYEGLCLSLICDTFGSRVLFREEVQDLIIVKYGKWVEKVEFPQGVKVTRQMSLTKTSYDLHPPILTMDAFHVISKETGNKALLNPLPILHPVFISMLLWNRENGENEIDMEDPKVLAVLHVVQETTPPPVLLQEECISLYSSSEEDEEDEQVIGTIV